MDIKCLFYLLWFCGVAVVTSGKKCEDITCLHGGTCIDVANNETGEEVTCHCAPGYIGRRCSRREGEETTTTSTTTTTTTTTTEPPTTTTELPTTTPCVVNEECSSEIFDALTKTALEFLEAIDSGNETGILSVWDDDFEYNECGSPPITCDEDIVELLKGRQSSQFIKITFCQVLTEEMLLVESLAIRGGSGELLRVTTLLKRGEDGQFLYYRMYVIPDA